mgnify:CR=1 FL=1
MKKLLLVSAMFMATSVWSIEVIDQDERMTVYCISDYVVIVTHLGGVEQMMRAKGKRGIAIGGDAGIPIPMQCKDYK